jgi:hypothetical protein
LFQLIPHVGFHSYRGDGGAILGPGLRVGALVGLRIGDHVSLNGEITADLTNATNLPPGDSYNEQNAAIGLSPLVALPVGTGIELAFGPKFAAWGASYYQTSTTRGDGGGSYSGLDLGANGAVFFQVGRRVWLGGLAGFDLRFYSQSCFRASGGSERCSSSNLPSSDKVMAFSALLMFSH